MKKKNQTKLALAAKKRYIKQIRAANKTEVRKDWKRAYNFNLQMLELDSHDHAKEWAEIRCSAVRARMFALTCRLWGQHPLISNEPNFRVLPALVELKDENPGTDDVLASAYTRVHTSSIHPQCKKQGGEAAAVDMSDIMSFIPPCAIDEVSRRIKEGQNWGQLKTWLLEIFSQFRETDDDEEKDPVR